MNAAAPRHAVDVDLLRDLGAQLGYPIPDAAADLFERYAAAILAANARMNLTRIVAPDEIARRHFLDSLICLRGLSDSDAGPQRPLRCVDVGSGAGLPGIALKILRPAWSVTLVEATGKKAAFLAEIVADLGLRDVHVLAARAEDVGREPLHRERYDLAVARAVALLPILVEYLLPLVRPGGRALALKGEDVTAEVANAGRALETLGGRLVELQPYAIPGVPGTHHLVILEKIRPTPPSYPRRPGQAGRRPLG